METVSNAELRLLLKRIDLTLTEEEMKWVAPVFQGYLEQLKALHSLDLEGEEVGGGFMPQAGSGQ